MHSLEYDIETIQHTTHTHTRTLARTLLPHFQEKYDNVTILIDLFDRTGKGTNEKCKT